MPAPSIPWTAERIERLKELWADDLSANQIAKDLGGLTRNAVIGKIHRLGLHWKHPRKPCGRYDIKGADSVTMKPIKRVSSGNNAVRAAGLVKGKRKGPSGTQLVTIKVERAVEPGIEADGLRDLPPEVLSPNAVSIHELEEHHCRWPIGEPGAEFRCCGRAKADPAKHPYCLGHARIAYAEKQPRKLSGGFADHYG